MPRRFVDLSIYLENDVISDPPAFRPRIEYVDHNLFNIRLEFVSRHNLL